MALRLQPLYLIHGDDHAGITERRVRLHARVEEESGSVELLEADAATPAAAAQALATMTLAAGRRVIVVDGAERWRKADFERDLAAALDQIPPETTLVLFAREDQRVKLATAIVERVKKAGGRVDAQSAVKPWELPAWVREQAARLGLELDSAASKALVRQVGERPQRLLRELEKLALESEERRVDAEAVERRAARSAEWRAYALADALVARDRARATSCYLGLSEQGERLSGLSYVMAGRVREALAVSLRLEAGEPPAAVKRTLRMPSRAADRFLADVAKTSPEHLRHAVSVLAQLELDSRGGAPLSYRRSGVAGLDEESLVLRAIGEIAA
jgi:DNA polymerase-3 subunit delta